MSSSIHSKLNKIILYVSYRYKLHNSINNLQSYQLHEFKYETITFKLQHFIIVHSEFN